MRLLLTVFIINLIAVTAHMQAAEYYVDYEAGNDSRDGLSPDTAWKHCPGDTASKAHKDRVIKAGDRIIFKGGVVYRGGIGLAYSGTENALIEYDGSGSKFGKGPAIIDGSKQLDNWQQCTGPEDCEHNPHWKQIYYSDIKTDYNWKHVHVMQGGKTLPVAQEPNMPDELFQEMARHYHKSLRQPEERRSIQIEAVDMPEHGIRQLVYMIDGSNGSAVINKLNGGKVKITWSQAVTLASFAVTPQVRYSHPKDMRIEVDGKTILSFSLPKQEASERKNVEHTFPFAEPLTCTSLTVCFDNGQEGAHSWGAIQKLAAYNAAGENQLLCKRRSFYKNPSIFTQTDANYWNGATFALYCKPARISYAKILGFNPEQHELELEVVNAISYHDGGSFSIFNSLKVLDREGEYVLKTMADGTKRVYLWPRNGDASLLSHGVQAAGFSGRKVSFVRIHGFIIRGQSGPRGGSGIQITGNATQHIIVEDCELTEIRGGVGIGIAGARKEGSFGKHFVVRNCYIHRNPGHCKGIVLRNADDVLITKCKAERNTSTALDYYTVSNGAITDCEVVDNKGMHANGITFYVACKNILTEGNRVSGGNVGLTFQDGDGLVVRNNIIESDLAYGIGVWGGGAYNNVIIANNYIRSKAGIGAIFGGNSGTKNLSIYNNILNGGIEGNIGFKADFKHNIIVEQYGPVLQPDTLPKTNTYVDDLSKIYAARDSKIWTFAENSKAIATGYALKGVNDADIDDYAWPAAHDCGPFSSQRSTKVERVRETQATAAALKAYEFQKPTPIPSRNARAFFKHLSTEPHYTMTGAAFTGQGGGNVRIKKEFQSIFGWDAKDHWLEWTFEAVEAGTYEICLNTTTGTAAKRSFIINGKPIKELHASNMTYTGGWRQWTDHYVNYQFTLKDGSNSIRLNNESGSLNVKNIRLYKIK